MTKRKTNTKEKRTVLLLDLVILVILFSVQFYALGHLIGKQSQSEEIRELTLEKHKECQSEMKDVFDWCDYQLDSQRNRLEQKLRDSSEVRR